MTDPTIPFCKDCKYFEARLGGPVCQHPEAKVVDYVTGDDYQMNCTAMRIRICGPQGRFWEKADDSH